MCRSENTRRMVETVAHLTAHLFPHLPVCEWALSVPERQRYLMQRGRAALNVVLRILLLVIAQTLSANFHVSERSLWARRPDTLVQSPSSTASTST